MGRKAARHQEVAFDRELAPGEAAAGTLRQRQAASTMAACQVDRPQRTIRAAEADLELDSDLSWFGSAAARPLLRSPRSRQLTCSLSLTNSRRSATVGGAVMMSPGRRTGSRRAPRRGVAAEGEGRRAAEEKQTGGEHWPWRPARRLGQWHDNGAIDVFQ